MEKELAACLPACLAIHFVTFAKCRHKMNKNKKKESSKHEKTKKRKWESAKSINIFRSPSAAAAICVYF